MSRFLKELRYFWRQVRAGYPRQQANEHFADKLRSLMGLEFQNATYGECVEAAEKILIATNRMKVKIYADNISTRCNRGKLKLADFVAGFPR